MPAVFSFLQTKAPLSPEALAFHKECLVFDLHIDTLLWMRLFGYDIAKRHRNLLPTSPFCHHLDLPRARQGGLSGAVLAVMTNPQQIRREQTLLNRLLAKIEKGRGFEQTLASLDLLNLTAESLSGEMAVARSGSELQGAVEAGRFGVLPGLEGAHGLEGDLDNLRAAHSQGLRLVGLVHFQGTEAGYPMTAPAFDGQGLLPFGYELIAEMESLGMVVDLAHLNAAGVDDALKAMKKPFVVSHTACMGIHRHRRNLDDDQIRNIADRGGVIGIAFARNFLGRPGLEGFIEHVEHAIRVGGADCVALGSDFDGTIIPAAGMDDVTTYPRVTAALLGRGHAPGVVRKVLGQNALRVITETCG